MEGILETTGRQIITRKLLKGSPRVTKVMLEKKKDSFKSGCSNKKNGLYMKQIITEDVKS